MQLLMFAFVAPVLFDPAGHVVQLVALALLYVPGPHARQEDRPTAPALGL